MSKLVRGLVVGLVLAVLGGMAPLAAQRVALDVRIGTPGFHYHRHHRHAVRHYHHGHRVYRDYYRPHAHWHGRSVIVVAPRARYHGRHIMVQRARRAHRHYQWY